MADIQALLSALDVFSRAPDKASIDRANSWLQDFQHSPEAWSTCNILLQSPDVPPAAKLFAAQTFRTKVTYDLAQVNHTNQLALRDTLLTTLETYSAGPRNIILQLSLAIVGLALQVPSWDQPVQTLIEKFGTKPSTVPTLLEFLTILPEEVNSNTKIPITDEEFHERSVNLLTNRAKQVLDLLLVYITATGVTAAVQTQVFACLHSWLLSGEISVRDVASTTLFGYSFEALASATLFDAAVEVICQMIHETQEIDENMNIIELIVPKVIELKPRLAEAQDDADKIRGYARIFTEAGETYRFLLIQHTPTFFPIVEAIGECSAYPDLDIVPITFPFWMRLAQMLGKKPSPDPLFINAYKSLLTVMINHLHFPSELTSLTGQEAENFRSFRHVMGDTLKDCCVVLRTDTCLMVAYQQVAAALTRNASWQEVEAPLFALRSMGAELDLKDSVSVPKIMDLIPRLPSHPRVRYTALMIISRYTEWINRHPDYIRNQLQYISSGFNDADGEVCAAAGQALKYMCQDCKEHLTDFLPTLHTFLNTGPTLVQDDKRQVYEAIAYVISAMPMSRSAESLKTFSVDILAQVHTFTVGMTLPTTAEIQVVGDGLENLEVMLHVIQGYGEQLPAACQNTCEEAWVVFNAFILKYGNNFDLAERITRVLRRGLDLFGKSLLPIAPAVIARMSFAFEATGFPGYLWIAGKVIGRFGYEEIPEWRGAIQEIFERSTAKVVSMLQVKAPREVPDVLEDYTQMLLQFIHIAPDILFVSSSFPLAFNCVMTGLTVVHSDIIFASLDFFRSILSHDCMDPPTASTPPNFPVYAATIRSAMEKEGLRFIGCTLNGFTGNFPEDAASTVVTIFRLLVYLFPAQLLTWLPVVLEQLPTGNVPTAAKAQFLQDVTNAINTRQHDKVKQAVLGFDRASRKTRDRRRNNGLQ